MTEEFIGKIVNVNLEKNQIVLNDKDGILQMFTYPESLDVVMQKQQPGWYKKLTLDDKKVVKKIEYADNPAYSGGGKASSKTFQQDQKLIAKEVVFKALVELKWETFNPEKETYDSMCEDVIRNFEMIMPRFLKDGEPK